MIWHRYLLAVATISLIVATLRVTSVEAAEVAAPLLLLDVVVVARFLGTGPALFAAASSSAALSYYFLPPAGFAIADPDDWIAFGTFLVTAMVAGELASRAERQRAEALAGRQQIERLYQELQAAFDRASEAEAARRNEQLKAALLEALTHNLRTPLTAIKAGVTALIGASTRTGTSELSAEERRELLQVIDEESDRLNRFIEGLSTTDRTEPSHPLRLRAVRPEAIVRAGLLRAETITRDHHIVMRVDDQLPDVSVDAAAMTEIIYILLDNASKYAPVGSAIALCASLHDDHHVRISVSDEGPGIPPELTERVFEKFFRVAVEEIHDRRRGGVGLGLPIARRLVEAQAGRIRIEPSPSGRGATVAIVLPVSLEAREGQPVAPAAAMGE